ncbi:MAG TPA: Ppx/GppA family phosphatase, partial [Marmoricola sp.]
MSALVPRWEWRGFGDELRAVESIFGRESSKQVVESDEVYVLSVRGTDGVKVRDELMDVKHLLEVNDDGLEQWVPVMKTGFPVSATDVGSVLRALRVDAQSSRLARAAYTLPEFLDDVVGPHPDLLAVEVHKRRERYTVGGCMAEVSEISTGHGSTHTVAIESEDAKRVIQTVRDVGLASRPNVSLVRGLKAMVGFGVERFAVVDVGTNSVKFHIGERGADGSWRTVLDRAQSTRLGDGLQETGQLNPEPIERTVAAIAEMAEEARQHKVAAIAAVGTAGLRIAPNSADLVEAVQSRSGVLLEVISGEQEARLAYLAAMAGIGQVPGSRVVFDTGGGSSQFTFGSGEEVEERFSV